MGNEWNNDYYENQNENEERDNRTDFEQDYAFQTLMRNGRPKTKSWSVASLVLGLISVVCCFLGWSGVILGVLAIVFAIISRKELGYFDGLSVAGLVLGIFGFILGAALLILTYSLPAEFWEEYNRQFGDIYQGGNFDGTSF